MKHPNPKNQKYQEDFLDRYTGEEREYHAGIFRIMNAAYRYHQLADSFVDSTDNKTLELYFKEWLEGLPANIRASMEQEGFETCKTMLPFSRFVNERNDIGMDEWMKNHLSEDDYNDYKSSLTS